MSLHHQQIQLHCVVSIDLSAVVNCDQPTGQPTGPSVGWHGLLSIAPRSTGAANKPKSRGGMKGRGFFCSFIPKKGRNSTEGQYSTIQKDSTLQDSSVLWLVRVIRRVVVVVVVGVYGLFGIVLYSTYSTWWLLALHIDNTVLPQVLLLLLLLLLCCTALHCSQRWHSTARTHRAATVLLRAVSGVALPK